MTASVRQARAKLSQLLESAANGEDVIITSNGKPRARLIAIRARKPKGLDMDKLRRLARAARTRKTPPPDGTSIISDLRSDR